MARTRTSLKSPDGTSTYEPKSDRFLVSAVKTAGEILSLGEQLEVGQAINRESIDYFIDLYKGNVPLNLPADKMYVNFETRSSRAADVIHRVMGMLMTPLQAYYIQPFRSQANEEKQKVIQKYLMGAMEWSRRKYGVFDIQGLFWQLLTGKGYIQQTWLPAYWDKTWRRQRKDEEDGTYNQRIDGYKAHMGPPFFHESLDPRIVFPIPRPMGTTEWVKKYKVARYIAEDSFSRAGKPVKFSKNQDSGKWDVYDVDPRAKPGEELPEESATSATEDVVYHEYIDERFIYYVCDDRVIHRVDHKGGCRIYRADGLVTGFKEYELQAVSILFAVRNELPQYDFLRSLWVQRAYIDVFPQLFAELAAGEDPLRDGEGNLESWKVEPMTVRQVRGRISNAFRDAQSGVDYRALMDNLIADIDTATLPAIARGIGGAQQPGYAINQLNQSMRTIFGPAIVSRELQFSNMYEDHLWALKHCVGEEVTVFSELTDGRGVRSGEYISIEPEDIQDFFHVRAVLKPALPIDEQGNMKTWADMGAAGWATDEEVSLYGFNNPQWKERRQQIEADLFRREARPAAMEDGIKLGKVRLEEKVAQSMGLDKLNPIFQQPLNALAGPGTGQTQEPPGLPAPAEEAAAAAQAAAGGTGMGPVAGENPGNPFPGPRMA